MRRSRSSTESKSILWAVAGEIERKRPNVVYCPSYEICMWHDNSFEADLRHVRRDRVVQIIEGFVAAHIGEPEELPQAAE